VRREKCPKCGQTVWESAIDRAKGNCFYCSGAPEVKIGEVVKRTREPTEEENQALPGVEGARTEKPLKLGRRID